jgi:hypothetical protein
MMTDKWTADPTRGSEYVKPRRDEIIDQLRNAADVAFYAIDQKLVLDIAELRSKASQSKAKIISTFDAQEKREPMEVVRLFWNKDKDALWKEFLSSVPDPAAKGIS